MSNVYSAMHVPEHISVTGEPLIISGLEEVAAERERMMGIMNIPDRIILAGGNRYQGFKAQPEDIFMDHLIDYHENQLEDLPSTLTLEQSPIPDINDRSTETEAVRSESSVAIDENPIHELKLMRRQLGRISSRLYRLEDEVERHKSREKVFITTIIGFAAAVFFAIFRR